MPGQEENLYELKNETDKLILGTTFYIWWKKMNWKFLENMIFTNEEILKYAEYIKNGNRKKYTKYNSSSRYIYVK